MSNCEEMQRFNALMAEIEAVYHEAALRFGLSDSASLLLYVLTSQGGTCALAELPYLTGMTKQTINSAVRKLESEGVLESVAVGARKKVLSLTEKGQALCAQTVARLIAAENEIFEGWSLAEKSAYLSLTKRYLDALREKVEML